MASERSNCIIRFRKVESNFQIKIKQRLENNKTVKQNVYASR